ncbi:MAG: hypothetical protein O2973_08540, partial [Gemmatimonadetes bacterium]|nr:hypothetical protein [Gemmatimonadota bacterium]
QKGLKKCHPCRRTPVTYVPGLYQTRHNEQLLLTARDGSGWLALLACRIVDGAPQQNCERYASMSLT